VIEETTEDRIEDRDIDRRRKEKNERTIEKNRRRSQSQRRDTKEATCQNKISQDYDYDSIKLASNINTIYVNPNK